MARMVLVAVVSGGPGRGRKRLGWMDDVKVEAADNALKIGKSGEPWNICR